MRHSMAWPRSATGPGSDLRQRLALRDADLALHDIDAGDELGHRMLHLHARVHFDEVELARLVHQELDRAGVGVAGARTCAFRSTAEISARCSVVHGRRGRFLEQFLVPPLDAAFALAQDLDVAVLVGQDLKLDVPRRADELLQVNVGRTERRARLVLRLREQRRQFLGAAARCACRARRRPPKPSESPDSRSPPPAPAPLPGVFSTPGEPGSTGTPHLAHERARALLDAHQADHVRLRPDELDAARPRRPRRSWRSR